MASIRRYKKQHSLTKSALREVRKKCRRLIDAHGLGGQKQRAKTYRACVTLNSLPSELQKLAREQVRYAKR